MIILSDENPRYIFVTQPYKTIASSHGKNAQQNEETCIGYNQVFITNDSSKHSDEIQAIEANDMKMVFYSLVNKTHFHKNGFVLRLVFWNSKMTYYFFP